MKARAVGLCGRAFALSAAICLTAQAGARRPVSPGPIPASLGILTHVPSAACGRLGVAVRVLAPPKPRYEAGAPVAINVLGGFGPGAAAGRPELTRFGFVELHFAFPGGGRGEARSGGSYDFRGPRSIRALADVIRFATGRLRDKEGRSLDELIPGMRVLYKNCGLIGRSQGGNACGLVMAEHGKEFPDLAFYASLESPYGEGAANAELGGFGQRLNPAYDPKTGKLDLSKLAYSPELSPAGKWRSSPETARLRGALFFDMDGDGRFDPKRDFLECAVTWDPGDGIKAWYSPRLLREAERRRLYGKKRPAHFPTVAEAAAFWHWRDAAPSIPQAVRNCPRAAVIVYANERDHVQTAPDHPHILVQVEGFRKAGARFVRLNPDRCYVESAWPKRIPLPADLRRRLADNAAGAAWDRSNIRAGLEPEELPSFVGIQAAACELADRTQRNRWDADLAQTLCRFEPLPPLSLPGRPGRFRPRPGPPQEFPNRTRLRPEEKSDASR